MIRKLFILDADVSDIVGLGDSVPIPSGEEEESLFSGGMGGGGGGPLSDALELPPFYDADAIMAAASRISGLEDDVQESVDWLKRRWAAGQTENWPDGAQKRDDTYSRHSVMERYSILHHIGKFVTFHFMTFTSLLVLLY